MNEAPADDALASTKESMVSTTKFLHPIKQSLTLISSHYLSIPHLKQLNYGKFDSLKTLLKSCEPSLCGRASIVQPSINISRKYLHNIHFSGNKFSSGSILGVSIACGSNIIHAIDAQDALVADLSEDSLDPSEEEECPLQLWKFARKFWLPVFFFLTVLTNLDDPITLLFVKVTLFLFSTKPSPFSVYIFVEQLCQQSMHQESWLHKVKSPYASKVEVQDYELLCLANVEVRGQKFTLIGILGNWWTLPQLPSWGVFSLPKWT